MPGSSTMGDLCVMGWLKLHFCDTTKIDIKNILGLYGLFKVRHLPSCPWLPLAAFMRAIRVMHAGADDLAVVSLLCAEDHPHAAAVIPISVCDEELKTRKQTHA